MGFTGGGKMARTIRNLAEDVHWRHIEWWKVLKRTEEGNILNGENSLSKSLDEPQGHSLAGTRCIGTMKLCPSRLAKCVLGGPCDDRWKSL